MPSNNPTSDSSISWNLPGIILNRGTANILTAAANIKRIAVTVNAETTVGLTSMIPKKLTLLDSCKTASFITSLISSFSPELGPIRIAEANRAMIAATHIMIIIVRFLLFIYLLLSAAAVIKLRRAANQLKA